ncbi:Putative Holin-X, holin superfamily III [Friedmanniella luteola]|uniref:Putative Holin-X, holin superfamily III n=1 Tax=Friedmanniella luteola TaxID=546871 RepID=A0A1H1N9B5_9ACTN|nr:phage holin family protein [Friedmanniella luteola]SDR95527.1 Putative Holin-X, holin superfamily III [Friedmanniella luteola]
MTTPYTSGSSSIEPQTTTGDELTLGERLGNVTRDLSTLMRQEVALAKAEVSQSASKAGKGIGLLAGAAVAGFFVLMFLSISLWRALGNEIGFGWSALIVAVIWAIIAAILAVVGKKALDQVRGVPETTDSLGKIPNALKGQEEKNL